MRLEIDDYEENTNVCIGKGKLVGTPEYCAKHKCHTSGTKFCFQPHYERAFYVSHSKSIPIIAWGTVKQNVYGPKEVTFLSDTESCIECRITCDKGGIRLDLIEGLQLVEACSEPFCYTIYQPGPHNQQIQFPLETSLHDFDVKVTLWKHGKIITELRKTCKKQPLCEAISCYACLDRIMNPQCNSTVIVILVILCMYFSAQMLYIVLRCILILRYSFTCTNKLCKYTKHACCKLMGLCLPEKSGRLPQIDVTRFTEANLPITAPLTKSSGRKERSHFTLSVPRATLTTAIIMHILCPALVDSCSQVTSLTASKETCVTDKNQESTCTISQSTRLVLVPQGQYSCLFITDEQGNTIGAMKIQVQQIYSACQFSNLYFTRNFVMDVATVKRCPTQGSCSGDKCAETGVTDKIDELNGEANDALGFTFCQESCGCWACKCFHCTAACLFYRTFAKPTNDKVYEIFDCPSWDTTVELNVQIQQSQLPVINTTANINASVHTFKLIPGVEKEWNNMKIALVSTSTPMVKLQKRFITDGTRTAFVETAPIGQLVKNTIGVMQCTSKDDAKNLKCQLSPDICSCHGFDTSVNCNCPNIDIEKIFADKENLLPLQSSGFLLKGKGNEVQMERTAFSALEIQIDLQGLKIRSILSRNKCYVKKAELSGCVNCVTMARLTATCVTDFEDALAVIQCDSTQFLMSCNTKETQQTLSINLRNQEVNEECVVECPGGTSKFKLHGNLLYLNRNPILNISNTISMKDTKDRSIEWDSILDWFKTNWLATTITIALIVGGILLCIVILPPCFQLLLSSFGKIQFKNIKSRNRKEINHFGTKKTT